MAKTSRRADGKPETAADKRFFDLRQKGYKGPIDRDGRKANPKSREAKILKDMRKASKAAKRESGGWWS